MLDDVRKSLAETARAVMNEHESYESAVDALIAAVRGDDDLYRAMVGPFERQAAFDALSRVTRDQRVTVWNRPTEPDARAAILAKAMKSTLLEFRLPSGKRLGDAVVDDVAAAADFYAKHSADMAWKARWLGVIAAKLPRRKRVAQVFDDAALAKIQRETQR